MNAKEFLQRIVYKRSDIDEWLSGKGYPFSRYDPDIGYLHRDRRCREGINGSLCTYTYDRVTRARSLVNHRDVPCRINTYGDSYTNCEQVNDGETWQEILAARIGEPIRNFGTGAQSVYQMYLRMIREEAVVPAKYMIVNIYSDDPFRSLVPWQRVRVRWGGKNHPAPPQPYIRANPATKEFRGFKNPAPESKDLYDFCDLGWVYENFKEDFMLRIMLAKTNVEEGASGDSYRDIEALAEEYGRKTAIKSPKKLLEVANSLFRDSAIYGCMRLVQMIEGFAEEHGKKVLFIGSYTSSSVADDISPGREPRLSEIRRPGHGYYKDLVEFLSKREAGYVDLMEAHLADYSNRKISLPDYLQHFWTVPSADVTHYTPAGNQFTASAAIEELVAMVNPKPPSYLPTSVKWDTCVSLDQAK